jgi:hypothetical protein
VCVTVYIFFSTHPKKGIVFVVLPKRVKKKKGKLGESRGKGEGERLEL